MMSFNKVCPMPQIRKLSAVVTVAVFVLSAGAVSAQSFDVQGLPGLSPGSRDAIVKDASGAPAGLYTLAISPTGRWEASAAKNRSTEERAANVLQRCEHREQAPCILAVVDGRATGETSPRPSGLTYPDAFDLAAVPFIREGVRSAIDDKFMRRPDHRALAINRHGSWGSSYSRSSADEAAKGAIENCAKNGRDCFVYAIDDKVVFTRETAIRP